MNSSAALTSLVPAEGLWNVQYPKETWVNWTRPGDPAAEVKHWIPRADVLKALTDAGVAVSERSLRYWETYSVLPRPIVRWRDGRRQTLYPTFAPVVIRWIPELKEQGKLLSEMTGMLKEMTMTYRIRATEHLFCKCCGQVLPRK